MFKRILMAIVLVVFSFGSAQAVLITYGYSGHTYQISGEPILGISEGTTFSGTFTYEDTQPLTLDGNYFCDFTLDINGGIASEDDARININSSYSGYWDSMGIYAEKLSGDTDFTSSIDKVRMIFYYTDLFSDASLPGSDLTMADFSWDGLVYIEGEMNGNDYLLLGCFDYLSTDIMQIAAAPVPEPATMLLFGSGLLGIVGFQRKQFKKK